MNLITIGAPAFILALEPNKDRIQGSFLSLVIERALPISLTVFTIVLLSAELGPLMPIPFNTDEISTVCVLLTTIIMLIYQFRICIPFNTIRKVMFVTLCLIFIVEIFFFKGFFSLASITPELVFFTSMLLVLGILLWKFYKLALDYIKKSYRIYIKKEDL